MSNIFKDLVNKFTSNKKLSVFVYCLLLSTFFWLLSALSKNYTASFPVKINYTSLSNDFVLTEQPADKVQIELRGSGFHLLAEKLSFNVTELSIDLNSAKPHYIENSYYIKTSDYKSKLSRIIDQDLKLSYLSPDTLYFKTEKRISKVVPVVLDAKLTFKPGFLFRGDIEISPKKVVISGPASALDTVYSVQSERISYLDMEDSISFTVDLVNPFKEKILMNPKSVNVLLPVEKFTEKKITLPIEVIMESENADLKIFPEFVELTYLVPLSKYQYLDEKIVYPRVIFNKDKANHKTLKVEVEDAVTFGELIKVKPEKVEFIIRQ